MAGVEAEGTKKTPERTGPGRRPRKPVDLEGRARVADLIAANDLDALIDNVQLAEHLGLSPETTATWASTYARLKRGPKPTRKAYGNRWKVRDVVTWLEKDEPRRLSPRKSAA